MSEGRGTAADLFQLALRHHHLGDLDQAAALYRQIIQIEPRHAGAHINLGTTLRIQGQPDAAAASYRQALLLEPRQPHALYNLGNIVKDQGDFTQAVACYREALVGAPDQPDILLNLGICLMHLGQITEAAINMERAGCLRPNHWPTEWNRVILRLVSGDLKGGWPGLAMRWTQPGVVKRAFTQPAWDGSPLAGKTILIYAERGLGDTFQFMRYLPLIKERGGNVVFECQPSLVKLLANIPSVHELIAAGAPLPPFDVHAALFDLPALFGTTLETIPAPTSYLTADSARVEMWRRELATVPGFKIGICWQASAQGKGEGDDRSIPLRHFEALAKAPGVQLVSLQAGPGVEHLLGRIENPSTVIDFGDRLDKDGAFFDTAALMMSLDLVVSIDSAIPHLAGALGVKTWLLLTMAADWRWLVGREDTPWYPNHRLFRRVQYTSWDEMLAHVARELATLAKKKVASGVVRE